MLYIFISLSKAYLVMSIQYKQFKFGKVSDIAYGTWRVGGWFWVIDSKHDDFWVNVLKKVMESGINLIDTAEMYSAGHAEELIGKALKDFDRDSIYIVTKLWFTHMGDYEKVSKYVNASSRRLGTYIDIYLLHSRPLTNKILCETMRALERLVDEGVIRYIGVSNFGMRKLLFAQECLKKYEIVTVQNHFSPIVTKDEKDIIPFTEKNNIMYMIYSPLEFGVFNNDEIFIRLTKKYNKTPVQVLLNWYISLPTGVPIIKTSKIEHLKENLGSMGWVMSHEDWQEIRSYYKGRNNLVKRIYSIIKRVTPP